MLSDCHVSINGVGKRDTDNVLGLCFFFLVFYNDLNIKRTQCSRVK